MECKSQVWQAFNHFNHADLDLCYKRAQGTFFREMGCEEATPCLKSSPKIGPMRSASTDAPFLFHHQTASANENRRSQMQWCKSESEFSLDKHSALLASDIYKHPPTDACRRPRGIGQCSPRLMEPERQSQNAAHKDLVNRGVFDIDQVCHRGRASCSETSPEALPCPSAKLDAQEYLSGAQWLSDLSSLGIECRRLWILESARKPRSGMLTSPAALVTQRKSLAARQGTSKHVPKWVDDLHQVGVECRRLENQCHRNKDAQRGKQRMTMACVAVAENVKKNATKLETKSVCSSSAASTIASPSENDDIRSHFSLAPCVRPSIPPLSFVSGEKISETITLNGCDADSDCSTFDCSEDSDYIAFTPPFAPRCRAVSVPPLPSVYTSMRLADDRSPRERCFSNLGSTTDDHDESGDPLYAPR